MTKAQKVVDIWNARYTKGQHVLYKRDFDEEWTPGNTRSAARLVEGEPVVWIEGETGGFSLEVVKPIGGYAMTGKLRNISTGDVIDVHSTTDSPDSSYGLECWVDDENNSYGQVQFQAPFGFELVEVSEYPE